MFGDVYERFVCTCTIFQAKWMNFYTDFDKGGLYLDLIGHLNNLQTKLFLQPIDLRWLKKYFNNIRFPLNRSN